MSQAYHPTFPASRNTFASSSKLAERSAANNSSSNSNNNNNFLNAAASGIAPTQSTQPVQSFGRSAPTFVPQRTEPTQPQPQPQPQYNATYTGISPYGAGGANPAGARTYGAGQAAASMAPRQDAQDNVLAELSDEQKEEINDAFSLFDLDKDRHIDYHELRVSLRALGFQTPKPEALQLMQQYGVPKPAYSQTQPQSQPRHPTHLLLPHHSFQLIAARKLLARDPREEVARAFSLFDVAGKGHIDLDDLRRVTRELGETSLSDAELEAMIEEFDYEGIPGGGVSREAFFGICLG